MSNPVRNFIALLGLFFLVAFLLIVVLVGPAGLTNSLSAWKAEAYGSHWLIVQYTATGTVLNSWEIDGSVRSEKASDGIYFTTPEGVVHLAGNYMYVQNPSEKLKSKYLPK